MNLLDRTTVWNILIDHVKQPHLQKHCVSVEIAMRAYATEYNEDPNYWGAIGLLHDVDFEKYPMDHPNHVKEILSPYGYDTTFISRIESHCRSEIKERTELIEKVLVSVDEMPGFILACALVRPDKSLDSLEVKSVKKKMKDKGFAKAVNRETLLKTAEDLGITIDDHIEFLIKALREGAKSGLYKEVALP